MAEFLLKEGADVNFRDQDQRSVLHKLDVWYMSNILNVALFTVAHVAVIYFYLQVSVNDSCWQWTNRYVAASIAVWRRYHHKRYQRMVSWWLRCDEWTSSVSRISFFLHSWYLLREVFPLYFGCLRCGRWSWEQPKWILSFAFAANSTGVFLSPLCHAHRQHQVWHEGQAGFKYTSPSF